MAILVADEITGTFSGSSAPASRGSLWRTGRVGSLPARLEDPEELRIEGKGRLKLRGARKFRGPVYASERLNRPKKVSYTKSFAKLSGPPAGRASKGSS
jgi:hypothetical protein